MNSMNNENPADTLLSSLKKEYVIIGAQRMKSWQGWFIIGIMVGIFSGVIWVANRSGQIEGGKAIVDQEAGAFVTITIDASQDIGNVKLMQGFLSGTAVDFPNPSLIVPLKPKFWRTGADVIGRPRNDLGRYAKATKYGSRITWDTSIGYYLQKGTWFPGDCPTCAPIEPWKDGFQEYKQYIKNTVQASIQLNKPVQYWDWWSEPEQYGRFGTQEQMFATFKAFHDAVREVERLTGVSQKIVAPSIGNFEGKDWRNGNIRMFKLEDFAAYIEQNNLRLDAFSWHEMPIAEDVPSHVAAVRTYFSQHPKLCNPTCPEIHINEFQGMEQSLVPGATIGWLYHLEKANADWASRACWILGGWSSCDYGMNGLLMKDEITPQANYWAHRAYADMDGAKKLAVETSDSHTIALASKNDAAREFRLLAGRYCHYGNQTWIDCYASGVKNGTPADVSLQIKNYPYGTNAEVEIYRIPNNNNVPTALPFPILVLKSTVVVQQDSAGGSVLPIMIRNFQDNDAYSITIKPLSTQKTLFLSSQFFYSNLGGLSGADAKCQTLANAVPSLTGKTFKAWLSDSVTSARDRLTHAAVPYKLVDGTVVANNWTDLTDGTLANPILKDEAGRTVASAPPYPYVWTDTNSDGSQTSRNIGNTCQNWAVTTSSIQGGVGFSAHTALSWTQHSSQNCALTARLYCMEQ